MCLGELGHVVERHGDVAVVRTDRGMVTAAVLLAPHVATGDHVVLHSGQVLSVVGAAEAEQAAVLRTGIDPTSRSTTGNCATESTHRREPT